MPFFSIVIPTFNSSATLHIAIESITTQSFEDLEIVIVDALSTDNTLSIVKTFNDPRIKIFSEKDNGIYDAMNKGIDRAKGEWIYFLGSDDKLYDSGVLENVNKYTDGNDVIYGDVKSARFNGVYDGEFTVDKIYNRNICHQSIFFKKDVFKTIGKFDLKYKSHADWDHNLKWFLNTKIKKKYEKLIVADYADNGFSSQNVDDVFETDKPEKFLKLSGNAVNANLKKSLFLTIAAIKKNQKKYFSFLNYKIKYWLLKKEWNKMVSVAMCTYNGELFLKQQLDSIFDQSVPVDELIICDDRSTDSTINIIEDYKKKYPQIISVYKNSLNKGPIKNFETAISKCKGDIIFLSDQDDVWVNTKVEKVKFFFENNSSALLLFTNGYLIDESGNSTHSTLWEKWNFSDVLQTSWRNNELAFEDLKNNRNKVTGATVAFRSELKKEIIPIKIPSGYWHDAWFALHAAAKNGLYFLNESLIAYRLHPNQQVGVTPGNADKNFKSIISENEFISALGKKYSHLFPKQSFLRRLLNKLSLVIC